MLLFASVVCAWAFALVKLLILHLSFVNIVRTTTLLLLAKLFSAASDRRQVVRCTRAFAQVAEVSRSH